MSTYNNHVGADGGSYPEIAARAVQNAGQQSPSAAYGYFRSGMQQKVYLFGAIDDAHGWLTALIHGQAQPYDYAAVFAAADLSRPVPGLESYGHAYVSGDASVGQLLPFLLGLPLGALGGYFYRGWQEKHPGHWIPGISGDVDTDTDTDTSNLVLQFTDAMIREDLVTAKGLLKKLVVLADQGDPTALDAVNIILGEAGLAMGPKVSGSWVNIYGPGVGGPWVDLVGPQVGGPWVDLAGPQVGGPWVDMTGPYVGADDYARRRAWPQTRALIESAKSEAKDAQAQAPAAAWVWSLDPTGSAYTASQLTPFSSVDQAQAYMFQRLGTPHVALALFDTASTQHWPNPIRWSKNEDPAYESLIAQRIAQYAPTRAAGDYVGASGTPIGTALGDVRSRAQTIANKRAGSVVGVIHTTKDNLWHALAFRNEDDADDWLGTATQDPASYTYAAYYDKNDYSWPHPVNEKIGGGTRTTVTDRRIGAEVGRGAGRGGGGRVGRPQQLHFRSEYKGLGKQIRGDLVGAAIDDTRRYAKNLATARPGNAAGAIRTAEGLWHSLSFHSLDDAIDWLQAATREKASFTYAAAFEKGSDGTAYFQAEEFGRGAPGALRAA